MSIKEQNAHEVQQACDVHYFAVHQAATNTIKAYNDYPWATCPTVQNPNPPKKPKDPLGEEWVFNQDKFDAAWDLFRQRGRAGQGVDGTVINFQEMSIDKVPLQWPEDAPVLGIAKRTTAPFHLGAEQIKGMVYAIRDDEAPPPDAKIPALVKGQRVDFSVTPTRSPFVPGKVEFWWATPDGAKQLGADQSDDIVVLN